MPVSDSSTSLLLKAATPDLYRRNAFRLTGLPVTASAREVVRQADKLKMLADLGGQAELAVVMTTNPKEVWKTELGYESWNDLAVKFYTTTDFSAPFALGSGQYDTMIIIPCSMGTLARIATGVSNDLITRSADVILKERRKLICVVRDTPYNLVHIRNMETVTLAGGIICPATPSFYSRPATITEVAATVVDRVLDLAGFDIKTFRWGK